MANDVKSGIGYLIPASGVVGFIIALLLGEFLVSILITVLGILVWFLYMLVMESTIPKQMGNMIMLFGVMLSVGIFLGFGVTQNMWGGFEFKPEGSLLSLVILFFAILTGLNFRNQQSILRSSVSSSASLSDDDRKFVLSAIDKAKSSSFIRAEPAYPFTTFFTGQPIFMSIISAPKSSHIFAASPITFGSHPAIWIA